MYCLIFSSLTSLNEILCNWLRNDFSQSLFPMSPSLSSCLNVYPSNLPIIPSSFLPILLLSLILPSTLYLWCYHNLIYPFLPPPSSCLGNYSSLANLPPPAPAFLNSQLLSFLCYGSDSLFCLSFPLSTSTIFILCLHPILLQTFLLLHHPPSLSVCDSQERWEECGEHVRSPEISLGSREQRSVVIHTISGSEPLHQWPLPVPHLSRWPGHPGLSWPGAEYSG